MEDPNAGLRRFLAAQAEPDHPTPPSPPAEAPQGIEAPPRGHVCAMPAADEGVKGGEGEARPLTPSADVGTPPGETTPLAVTDLVWWSTARQYGHGQVQALDGDQVTIRPLLPIRSHTVRADRTKVHRLATAAELARWLNGR